MISEKEKISDIFLYLIETNDLLFSIEDGLYFNGDIVTEHIPSHNYNDVLQIRLSSKKVKNLEFTCMESLNIISKLSKDYQVVQPIPRRKLSYQKHYVIVQLISKSVKNHYDNLHKLILHPKQPVFTFTVNFKVDNIV